MNFKELIKPKEASSTLVGLDIGTSSVKIVKLKPAGKDAFELLEARIEPCFPDADSALKNIAASLDAKDVAVSLSGPSVMLRYILFPKMQEEELKRSLKFEAQKHIPFSLNEVTIDSHILNDIMPDGKMLVLLAAVKKEFLNNRLALIDSTPFKIRLLDVDSLALINAFNFNYGDDEAVADKTVSLLNIGANFSNLNIVDSRVPRLSRDISVAGNNFTQKIADMLGLDKQKAEDLKRNPAKDKEALEKVQRAVESIVTHLANEIRISFDYYESQNASSVSKIFLSGGGSLFVGLKDILSHLLGIEVEFWSPFRKFSSSGSPDQTERNAILAGSMSVATGLALRANK